MAEAVEAIDVPPEDLPGSAGAKARGEDITTLAVAAGRGGGQVPGVEPITQEDISSIVGRPSGFDVQPVPSELIESRKAATAASDAAASEAFGIVGGDLNRLHRIVNAEGVGPDEMPLWNADAERRKYEYDPIQAFGSVGSVFATIASAFTRRPMINALNASAAAMEATREAKKEDYQRAYTAWKDNTDLVIKRHNLMHQQYSDAADLSTRDMALGKIQIENIARKFNDQATLYFMEHGMWKEWLDAQSAQATAATKLGEAQDAMSTRLAKNYDISERLKQLRENGGAKSDIPRTVREWHRDWENVGRQGGADQEFIDRWRTEHPHGTSDEFAEAFGDFKKGQHQERFAADAEWADRYWTEHPGAQVEDFARDYAAFKRTQRYPPGMAGGGGNTSLTDARRQAAEKERLKKKYIDEGMEEGEAFKRAEREVDATVSHVTGNRRQQIDMHIAQYDNAFGLIDKSTGVLERYVGAAGIAGRVTRMGERVSNIFGSNKTDREQFMRDISLLQAMAPQLLLDRTGRPLSAEAARVSDIIGGLSAGDTTANTMRSLKDIKVLLKKMQNDVLKSIHEEKPESETPAGATPDSGSNKNWYENYQ